MIQLSHPYMTTGKTIALTRQIFIGKSMSLLFNMLFVLVFLPRSKCLLISQLQSQSAVILEPKKIKSVTLSIVSPSIYHEMMGSGAMILVFWMLSLKLAREATATRSPHTATTEWPLLPTAKAKPAQQQRPSTARR